MNIKEHYETYRELLSKDALKGYEDYAKKTPTAQQEKWPSVYDYLAHAVTHVRASVQSYNVDDYKKWLPRHQEAMILLFEFMAKDVVRLNGSTEEAFSALFALGWNWYKFSNVIAHFDNHIWVPRYCKQFDREINSKKPCFSADEMQLVLKNKPHKYIVDAMISAKKDRPQMITHIDEHGRFTVVNPTLANKQSIVDWTQELFV